MHAAYVRPSHVRVIMSRERVDGWGGGVEGDLGGWRWGVQGGRTLSWVDGGLVIDEQRKRDPRPATRGVTLPGTP